MSFITILETLLIGPLKLIFEVIFYLANKFIGHPGLAIIVLSLIMNILVLPLYKRADAMQEAARDVDAKLRDGVAHIKKTFTGDERMMILQTYYRQNNYKPTDALNGSVSLLLEIPFFMAAYQFLSHLEILSGVSLGPITDLSAPDGLLVIGGLSINLLPILMTLVNVISSALYLKGFPLKTKIQLYGMALFFLVFLYTSPSCLVFYWTLNNVFSLVKTIFYKLKNPKKVLNILTALVGLVFIAFSLFFYDTPSIKRKLFLCGIGIVLLLPLILSFLKPRLSLRSKKATAQPDKKLFMLGSLFLTILVGAVIPSTFIAASPQEYVDINYFHNPLWYIVSALCLSAGTFLVWMGVFYWLASPKGKVIFARMVWILCGVMLVNYMFFGTDLGIISSTLQYENGISFTMAEQLINLLVLVLLAVAMYFIATKWRRAIATVLLIAVIALGGMSVVNAITTKTSIDDISLQDSDLPSIQFSQTEENVVVIMLDRAMSIYVPYIFNEKPELKEQFDGFTSYSNTISYGPATNFGTPALFGGYEYTPVELNKRDDELLVTKHNEALKVMPVLFAENGYKVTVCDPPYANYQWIPDLSIYDEYENIDAYITNGKFNDIDGKKSIIESNYRNFFCFSLMKCMPLFCQTTIYDSGRYNQITADSSFFSPQVIDTTATATGINTSFKNAYNVLTNLSLISSATTDETGAFLLMSNDATHQPTLLQTPDYTLSMTVDNTKYDAENADRFVVDGQKINMENTAQMSHYHANMAALIQMGNWFDYLREIGVYDNTRIILVADHGYPLAHFDNLILDKEAGGKSGENFLPLLMVKDFNSTGFAISDQFMTNADVPTLAVQGLIENATNPFTGNPINNAEKTAHDQYIIVSSKGWETTVNNGNTYLPTKWASVKDDAWVHENWTFYKEDMVLTDHAVPN